MSNETYGGRFVPLLGWSLLTTDPKAGRKPALILVSGKPVNNSSGICVSVASTRRLRTMASLSAICALQRHQLADFHARDVRLDRLELATILHRRLRLQIIHVDVRRGAAQVDHDDGLARRPGLRRVLSLWRAVGLEPQQISQRQTTNAKAPTCKKPRRDRPPDGDFRCFPQTVSMIRFSGKAGTTRRNATFHLPANGGTTGRSRREGWPRARWVAGADVNLWRPELPARDPEPEAKNRLFRCQPLAVRINGLQRPPPSLPAEISLTLEIQA